METALEGEFSVLALPSIPFEANTDAENAQRDIITKYTRPNQNYFWYLLEIIDLRDQILETENENSDLNWVNVAHTNGTVCRLAAIMVAQPSTLYLNKASDVFVRVSTADGTSKQYVQIV